MTVAGCQIVESYPLQQPAYEKYERERSGYPYEGKGGPWLAVYFATAVDLESISRKRGAHSLGYSAFQCPKPAPHEYSFLGGIVFRATAEEKTRIEIPSNEYLYKVYLAVDLAATIETSPFLHWPEERALVTEEIRSDGLCIEIGGGSMIGTGLESNTVKLPIDISVDPLRIVEVSQAAECSAWRRPHNNALNLTVTPLACARVAPAG
jgi:hypothetical protein